MEVCSNSSAGCGDSNYIESIYSYADWITGPPDERVASWLLMSSFTPTLQLAMLYLLMVILGPKVMANRKPFGLNWALIPYNITMAVINAYITVIIVSGAYMKSYSLTCQKLDMKSYDYWDYSILTAIWWYYFSKLLEFCDTAFFILRKKNNQMSFLHVYHHVSMFCFTYLVVKWFGGGSPVYFACINASVHIPMYTYYGLAAACAYVPGLAKFLWWKRYITVIQLTQFVVCIMYGVYIWCSGCGFPVHIYVCMWFYAIIMIILFSNFYRHAYKAKADKRSEVKSS